jgi:hypothetical protein
MSNPQASFLFPKNPGETVSSLATRCITDGDANLRENYVNLREKDPPAVAAEPSQNREMAPDPFKLLGGRHLSQETNGLDRRALAS